MIEWWHRQRSPLIELLAEPKMPKVINNETRRWRWDDALNKTTVLSHSIMFLASLPMCYIFLLQAKKWYGLWLTFIALSPDKMDVVGLKCTFVQVTRARVHVWHTEEYGNQTLCSDLFLYTAAQKCPNVRSFECSHSKIKVSKDSPKQSTIIM